MTAAMAMPWSALRGADVSEQTDDDLVRMAKKHGDAETFSELVRRHEHTVYNLAYRFMRDPDLAEDMAQEAFLKAFRLLRSFRGDCAFSTWMYRVTCNVCLSELSCRKRRSEASLTSEHENRAAVPPASPSDTAEVIRRCVSRLPDHYARIITLYYLKEIPYDEIAEVMEVPKGTLKTWMHRARQQLRTIVEQEISPHDL